LRRDAVVLDRREDAALHAAAGSAEVTAPHVPDERTPVVR
jgi:hypothetical protein